MIFHVTPECTLPWKRLVTAKHQKSFVTSYLCLLFTYKKVCDVSYYRTVASTFSLFGILPFSLLALHGRKERPGFFCGDRISSRNWPLILADGFWSAWISVPGQLHRVYHSIKWFLVSEVSLFVLSWRSKLKWDVFITLFYLTCAIFDSPSFLPSAHM